MDEPRDPGLENVLQLQRELILDGMYVMLPGQVVSYDATKQMAVVQPAVRHRYLAEDGETVVVEDYPPIHNVPVEFCGPARARITWPVAGGDPCEIRFSSASLARWTALGGTGVDPGDDRRSDISDAICFVGLHSPASPPTDAPTDAVVVHVSGGTTIKLGSSGAGSPVPQGDNLQSALNNFLTALSAYASGIKAVADPSSTSTPALLSAISVLQSAAYLSATTFTE